MLKTLRPEILNVSSSDGKVLVDAPGLAVTLDVEAASFLSDQLIAAVSTARLQQTQIPHDERPIDWV